VEEATAFFARDPEKVDEVYTLHLMNLAAAQRNVQELDRAAVTMQRVLELQRRIMPDRDDHIGMTLCNLGAVLEEAGRPREALPVFEEALAVRTRAHGADSHEVAYVRLNQGAALVKLEHWGEAERSLRLALEVLEDCDPAAAGQVLDSLAEMLEAQGRLEEAEPKRAAAIVALTQGHGDTHPEVAKQYEAQAALLGKLGRTLERDLHSQKAKQIREALRCSVS
jgi:tetratricopeptide (TPR) repeat protein